MDADLDGGGATDERLARRGARAAAAGAASSGGATAAAEPIQEGCDAPVDPAFDPLWQVGRRVMGVAQDGSADGHHLSEAQVGVHVDVAEPQVFELLEAPCLQGRSDVREREAGVPPCRRGRPVDQFVHRDRGSDRHAAAGHRRGLDRPRVVLVVRREPDAHRPGAQHEVGCADCDVGDGRLAAEGTDVVGEVQLGDVQDGASQVDRDRD
ncbi:MAG: hypothetical protein GY898_30705 [Proteobacteria bacterium]|nr:hypothetical protein [Pseudomonadota bacterium]